MSEYSVHVWILNACCPISVCLGWERTDSPDKDTSEMKYSGYSVYTEPQRAAAVWGFFFLFFVPF